MFGLVLVCAVTLLQAYAFWRAASLPVFAARGRRILLLGFALVLWGVFVAARLYGHARNGRFEAALDAIGMHWMGAIFLIAVALLAVDLLTGFGAWLRCYRDRLRTAALAVGMALAVVAVIQGRRAPGIESYDVAVNGLPSHLDGTTIVALSDLHIGSETSLRWVSDRVDQVIQQRPDLILFLGDVVEGHGGLDARFARELSRLSAPLGVWGVAGNHELHGGGRTNGDFQKAAGIRVLEGQSVRITPGLMLAGARDMSYAKGDAALAAELARTLPPLAGEPTILMSHAPVGLESAAQHGVSLMLSGHTHGGQLWPFTYLVATRYSIVDGMCRVGNMTVIVCRGTGTWGPAMRLWKPGVIVRVTLHRQS